MLFWEFNFVNVDITLLDNYSKSYYCIDSVRAYLIFFVQACSVWITPKLERAFYGIFSLPYLFLLNKTCLNFSLNYLMSFEETLC